MLRPARLLTRQRGGQPKRSHAEMGDVRSSSRRYGPGRAGWHGIGWQDRPESEGGPCFLIVRRTGRGLVEAAIRYPLTEDGSAQARRALVADDPAPADKAPPAWPGAPPRPTASYRPLLAGPPAPGEGC